MSEWRLCHHNRRPFPRPDKSAGMLQINCSRSEVRNANKLNEDWREVVPWQARQTIFNVLGVCTHGAQLQSNSRPRAKPTELLTQTSRAAKQTSPHTRTRCGMPTQPWAAGIVFKTHLTGSKAGGKLIHKLVRAAQSTQV
jgi:hypothetical protein